MRGTERGVFPPHPGFWGGIGGGGRGPPPPFFLLPPPLPRGPPPPRGALHRVERPPVVARHHLDELGLRLAPPGHDALRHRALGVADVAAEGLSHLPHIFIPHQRLDIH